MQTVKRALQLLKLLSTKPLQVQEVAKQLNIHISSASRILSTLYAEKFVRLNSEHKYGLGYAVFELAHLMRENLDLRKVARPYLEALNAACNEIIHLAVLDDGEVVYIDKLDTNRTIRMYSRIGGRSGAYCTGVGKALLAYLDQEALQQLLANISLKRHTKRTMVDKPLLLQELETIRKRGIAWDRGEHEENIYCIASPILDFLNKPVASISISTAIYCTPVKTLGSYSEQLINTAKSISHALGYIGDWPPSSSGA